MAYLYENDQDDERRAYVYRRPPAEVGLSGGYRFNPEGWEEGARTYARWVRVS